MARLGFQREIVIRICIIAAVFSAVSLKIVERKLGDPGYLAYAVPLLFLLCGGVMLLNVLFVVRKHRAAGQQA